MAEKNFCYYEPRCAHGSSLGTGMHALVAARLGHAAMALHYLRATAASDLDFDPNSAGGVRIAGLGALWQVVILGFAGFDLKGDMLGVDPRLRRSGAAGRWCRISEASSERFAATLASVEAGQQFES
jgi:trehalose/maltose hydrolase-like predicted phosphorylase